MDKTRMQQYMSQIRAMFNKHALYSDESPQYQIPFEPNPGDTVKINVKLITPVALEEKGRFAIREGGKTVGAGAVVKITK